jgi:hypothetical protein
MLRCISHLPPESASLSVVMVISPASSATEAQNRLSIFLSSKAIDTDTAQTLALLLERGPIAPYYELAPVQSLPVPREDIRTECHVVRRTESIEPIHLPEMNDRIPPFYYSIQPFCPNEQNDYLLLDRVFSKLCEPAVVEIAASPTDISTELAEHTRYLARLAAINRSWDRDDDDAIRSLDYLGSGAAWRSADSVDVRPLRREDPMADDMLRRQRRFHETLIGPNLSFRIRAMAPTGSTAHLIGSMVAECGFREGAYRLVMDDVCPLAVDGNDLRVGPWALPEKQPKERSVAPYEELDRLAHVASADELSGVFRLPIAGHASPCCIRKNTDPTIEKDSELIVVGFDQEPPSEAGTSWGIPRGIPVSGLPKHAFIGGVPGVGKTTSGVNLAVQANERDIPCLIFEATKTEYRQLKIIKNGRGDPLHRLAADLRVYSPGNETVSPLRFNPMWIRPGISCDSHIDNLLQCFNAAMPMSGPLPALLREACEMVYEENPDRVDCPVISDLFAATERILDAKGYSPETNSDIRAALEVRLGMLTHGNVGRLFQCPQNVPAIDELLASPTIIELDGLAHEQACLTTLFLLTAIREWAKTTISNRPVRVMVFIEEAHLLVGRSTDATPSEVHADPKAHAAEAIVRMLAEFRALGVAIVILDQLPSAVAPEVIKNTALKIGYRQVAREDREELGATMLFGPLETEEIARLQPGEAYFYREGYHGPRRIRTVNPFANIDRGVPLLNEAIVPYLCDESWFARVHRERCEAELDQLLRQMNVFDSKRLAIVGRTAELIAAYPRILAAKHRLSQSDALRRLRRQTRELRNELTGALARFERRCYRPLLGSAVASREKQVGPIRDSLIARFETVIGKDTQACIDMLNVLVCRTTKKLIEIEGV